MERLYRTISRNATRICQKIKFQLNSQGFNRITDFVNQAGTNYFMEDTIHLGWKGWLAADQQIRPFLEENQLPSRYHLDDAFSAKIGNSKYQINYD